jgi:hypothetical protein
MRQDSLFIRRGEKTFSSLMMRRIANAARFIGMQRRPFTPFSFKCSALWPSVSVSPSDKASEGPHFTPHSVPGLVPIKRASLPNCVNQS